MDRNVLEYRAKLVRAWIERRNQNGKPWTEDQLWAKIKSNWPTLSERHQEQIFQAAGEKR